MPDLFEALDSATPADAPIEELRLEAEASLALSFTAEVTEVPLHYEKDPEVRAYVVCPGKDCPLCQLGNAAKAFLLLPLYDVESASVRVLRIAKRRGPASLADALLPKLRSADLSATGFLISRHDDRYSVEAQPISENADRGERAICDFLQAMENGLDLRSAFVRMTAAELAEVPRIKRKLDALGGWKPKS